MEETSRIDNGLAKNIEDITRGIDSGYAEKISDVYVDIVSQQIKFSEGVKNLVSMKNGFS